MATPTTYTAPTREPWDALALRLLGSEEAMAHLLALNPDLAPLAECPAGAVVRLPPRPLPTPTVAPSLPPWKR